MKNRKRIGVMVVHPEQIYQKRVMEGIMIQCERYDYDVVCFTPLVDIWFSNKDYLNAELNIWKLINFDLIDAMIVVSISLTRHTDVSEINKVEKFLREHCKKPVVSLDIPMEGAEYKFTDDAPAFRKITAHVIDVHGVDPNDIYFLSGRSNLDISVARVKGFCEELLSRDVKPDISKIFYGDFWYSGGARLAERIISGELAVPRAVICGNDHMAMGLANRLHKAGIKVPEQVIVTGYDATQDAVVNEIPITSFVPDVSGSAEEAVNLIRQKIDPDLPVLPTDPISDNGLRIGCSCGCQTDIDYIRANFQHTLYKVSHDYTDGFTSDIADMSTVIESYMLEKMTQTKSPDESLDAIYQLTYLLKPYRNFYLVLRPDWLNTYHTLRNGYPDTVRTVIHSIPEGEDSEDPENFHRDEPSHDFPTTKLLPSLCAKRAKPAIFYFAPVHFQEDTLGYCVLQCDLSDRVRLTPVFRFWVRNVNNALEIIRVQHRLLGYSLYDSMTGLHNRRGMDQAFRRLCRKASVRDSCFVCVIDMNWLKRINDEYGHAEGDYAIMQLARCASDLVTDDSFFAVRAGGDEFFVIGIGRYPEKLAADKKKALLKGIEHINRVSGRPYEISAGVGCCLKKYSPGVKLETLIHEADQNMYEHKKQVKSQRS